MELVHSRRNVRKGALAVIVICIALLTITYSKRINMNMDNSILDGTLYACPRLPGRLGNIIYQYASAYGLSRMYNLTLLLAKDDSILKYFKVPSAKIIKDRNICQQFEYKSDKLCCTFDESFLHLERKSYRFGKYMQSWKYFRNYFSEVRSELEFTDDIKNPASAIVESFRRQYLFSRGVKNATVVGIHVRRGDIVTNKAMRAEIMVPDGYIYRAMDYVMKKYPNAIFIVCSNGMDHVKPLIEYKNVTALYMYTSPIRDIATLSSCDHVIMTYGTFGWWAGFLSGGEVVYYTYPFTDDSVLRQSYNYEDFYPSDWTGLE